VQVHRLAAEQHIADAFGVERSEERCELVEGRRHEAAL
jgi:hypothetical protein